MMSPTDNAPPPSYQMTVEEFDQKTARAVQIAPSTTNAVDEDGWPVYDPAAFEAVAESYQHSPPSSSSARILGTDTNRHVRQRRPSSVVKVLPSTRPMKTRSSERNSEPEDEEPRVASPPPPPFSVTGPSLDGPPFEEVVGSSYNRPYSQAAPSLDIYPPSPPSSPPPPRVLQPVEPLRLRSNRHTNSQTQAPYPSHRQISPRPNPVSTIARVEFDPRMAYSPYSGMGNHTSVRADATAFYNHAVASHLTTSPGQTQSGYMERVSSPYSPGHAPTQHWAQQATSSVSLHEQYAPHTQNFRMAPAVPPPPPLQHPHPSFPGVGYARSSPNGADRGPLPPVPTPLSQPQWAGSEAQMLQDVYGAHG